MHRKQVTSSTNLFSHDEGDNTVEVCHRGKLSVDFVCNIDGLEKSKLLAIGKFKLPPMLQKEIIYFHKHLQKQ